MFIGYPGEDQHGGLHLLIHGKIIPAFYDIRI